MRRLKLSTCNKYTLLDNDVYEWASKTKWRLASGGYVWGQGNKFLHRLIMQTPMGKFTDHINGNKLDNRRSNLRIVTKSQNNMNKVYTHKNPSKQRGVSLIHRDKIWQVEIYFQGHRLAKEFKNMDDAVNQRKAWEKIYHGEFARKIPTFTHG